MLVELFKNKGSARDVNNYRDIFLGDDSGKAISQIARSRLLPMATALTNTYQFGSGFNGGETCFAHLYIRLFIDICLNLKLNASVLFVDVVTAFASMLRSIIFDIDEGDEAWLRKLRDRGFSEDDINQIYSTVTTTPWLQHTDAANTSGPASE